MSVKKPRFDKDRVLIAEFEEDGVAMSLQDNRPYILNRTGIELLRLCNGRREKKTLVTLLAKKYALAAQDISSDVEAALRGFRDLGLVK